ncbi:MAG: sulfite exporter TauE/SafE family protein [Actinomycetota bacterium]
MTLTSRALLVSPLGLLIGVILGALGGGGSVLAVPVLVYVAGQDARAATTTSLILVGIAALVGLGSHLRAGRVRVHTAAAIGLCGVGGSLIGTQLNRQVDPDLLLFGFAAVLFLAAWRMRIGCPTCTRVGEQKELGGSGLSTAVRQRIDLMGWLKIFTAGMALGFLTGLFGVGGGFVIVPTLTLVLGISMPQAIGTSLLIVAINSAVALAARFPMNDIEWAVTLPFTVAAVIGVVAGGKIADRIESETSLRWFSTLLLAVAVYTAVRAGAALI